MTANDCGLPPLDAGDLDEVTQVDTKRPEFEPEKRPVLVDTQAARRTAASPVPPPAPAPAMVGENRRALDEIWAEPPRKREIPPKLRIGVAAAVLLLVIVVAFGSRGAEAPLQPPAAIDDDMVVSADDLKDRREVSAQDFRPKRQFLEVAPRIPAPSPPNPEPDGVDLAERRSRRSSDPEDILTVRKSQGASSSSRRQNIDEPLFDGPVYVGATAPDPAFAGPDGSTRALLAGGTTVAAVLVTPLELRGDSATVLARVEKAGALPAGTRFVGTASVSGSRVTMRFRSLFLPDGGQARVDGEAQDEHGAFGLATDLPQPVADDGSPSVTDIAKDTASDVLLGALGSDLAGRAAEKYLRSSRSRRPSRERPTFMLAAGTPLRVFLHAPVERSTEP